METQSSRAWINTTELKKVSLFSSLPENEVSDLVDAFHLRSHGAGDLIFAEGDSSGTFFIILAGEIEIVKALGTPEELLLSVMHSGDYLGEMGLLNPEGTRTAGARAKTAIQLMEMTRVDFEALLNRRPHLALDLLRDIIARMREGENAAIRDLEAKNRQLAQAYDELTAAQERLIAQEKIAHELDIAHRIQTSLLPKALPEIPGRRMEVHWQPARFVGGDFYDFIEHPDGRLGMIVADVSGKGVPAALVMAVTRSILRPAAERLVSPGAVLDEVNELLCPDMPANMFVTCLYVLLDPADSTLRIANAGHNLPLLCSRSEIFESRATGMPLGLMPEMEYEEVVARLMPDSAIVMFSDGLVEAHGPDREMFGTKRLLAIIADRIAETGAARGLIPYLLERLAFFTGPGWEQEDDVTLLSLEPLDR